MDKKIVFPFLLLFLIGSCSNDPKLVQHQGYALGTSYTIQYAELAKEKEQIQQGVDSLFTVVNQSLSTYLPNSDISKINRGDSLLIVDEHFKKVFEKANTVWYRSQGYFDPTVGAWVNAYGFGPDTPLKTISQRQRDSLMRITGWPRLQLTKKGQVKKDRPGIYLDFNAIAKGYAVDVVSDYLRSLGSQAHLVEIGGEVMARGVNPKTREGWKIGIDNPLQTTERTLQSVVTLTNQALATSGNYRKYRMDSITGEKYVHSINPRNGLPARSKVLSASVRAPDCMSADAYATALMVMPMGQAQSMIESLPNVEALWLIADKQGIQEVYSSNW